MVVTIEMLVEASEQAVADLNVILPQMSHEGRKLTLAHLERLLAAEGALFVARDDMRIVGCAYLSIEVIPTKVKGWIEDVVVDQAYRGQGIARRLLAAAIARARHAGCMHVNMTSRVDRDAAHALYSSLGFSQRASLIWRLPLE